MVTKYAMDLFNDPFFIGFNRELSRLNTAHKTNSQSYPPYDLLKLDEDTYQISLAIAGFSKEDIDVSVDNGTLDVAKASTIGHQTNIYTEFVKE